VADPLKTIAPPHMCCHVKFGRCASKGVCIERNPKIGERWGPPPCDGGVADPGNRPFPPSCYRAKFGRSVSNGTSVYIIAISL